MASVFDTYYSAVYNLRRHSKHISPRRTRNFYSSFLNAFATLRWAFINAEANIIMNSLIAKLEPTDTPEAIRAPLATRKKLAAYVELTKPRITLFIVLTAAAGFCLGTEGALDYALLAHTLVGVALLSSDRCAQQYWRRAGGRMRAPPRPLHGKLSLRTAWVWDGMTIFAEVTSLPLTVTGSGFW